MKSQLSILLLLTILCLNSFAQTQETCTIEYQSLIEQNDVETIKANFLDRKIKLTKKDNDIYCKDELEQCAYPLPAQELMFTVKNVLYWQGQILMQYDDNQYLVLDDFADFEMRELLEKPAPEPEPLKTVTTLAATTSIAAKTSKIKVLIGDALDNFTNLIRGQITPEAAENAPTPSPEALPIATSTVTIVKAAPKTEASFAEPKTVIEPIQQLAKTEAIAPIETAFPEAKKGLLVGAPLEKTKVIVSPTKVETAKKVVDILPKSEKGLLLGEAAPVMKTLPTEAIQQTATMVKILENQQTKTTHPKWLTKKRKMNQQTAEKVTLKRQNPLQRLWDNPVDGNFFGNCANGKCSFNPYGQR